ncbi:hypothetical protein GE21DRAFT_1015920 [Neurospora crassa]|nr:hypothetical protein 15E6.10 [imported] - Neurospora crassa [Neurospora crassa]KHE80822.1 hypothetical protein GE21DRAFT_1015920 [Neurospora crassa]
MVSGGHRFAGRSGRSCWDVLAGTKTPLVAMSTYSVTHSQRPLSTHNVLSQNLQTVCRPNHRRHSVLRNLFSKTSTAQLIRLAQGSRTSSESPSITQKEAQFSKFGGQPRRVTCGSALVKSQSRGIRCHTIFDLHRFLRR